MADTIFYYSDNTTSSSSDSFIGANSRDLNKTLIGVDVGSVVGFMDDAFLNCTNLINVSLGNTAIYISNNCFRGCTNLTTINIPNTVQFLGASAFRDCFNLSNVRIGSGVFQIGYNCFQNCTALSKIIIPSNVTELLNLCFFGCSNLKKIYFNGNPPFFDISVFFNSNVNLKLYRKKNFVTGWPTSVQGVPVVLWSDNVIKSGGTGKLIGYKRKEDFYYMNNIPTFVDNILVNDELFYEFVGPENGGGPGFDPRSPYLALLGPLEERPIGESPFSAIDLGVLENISYYKLKTQNIHIILTRRVSFAVNIFEYKWQMLYYNPNNENDELNGTTIALQFDTLLNPIPLENAQWDAGNSISSNETLMAKLKILKTTTPFPMQVKVTDSLISERNKIYNFQVFYGNGASYIEFGYENPSNPNDYLSLVRLLGATYAYIYQEIDGYYYYNETNSIVPNNEKIYLNQFDDYNYYFETDNPSISSDPNIKVIPIT